MTSLITLQEAKDFLNITTSASDSELPLFTDAASQMWLARGLPGAGTARVEWYDGGAPQIALRYTPVVSVTTITETIGGVTYTLTEQPLGGGTNGSYAFTCDPFTGIVTRRVAGTAVPFASGTANVQVSYSSGFATVPEDIKQAIKLLTKHLWETQRGGARRPGTGGDDFTATYTWPNRVQEIAEAYSGPGSA